MKGATSFRSQWTHKRLVQTFARQRWEGSSGPGLCPGYAPSKSRILGERRKSWALFLATDNVEQQVEC